MSKIKVLMVGPAPEVKGGISGVVQTYMASDLPNRVELRYLSTHVDGSKLLKLYIAFRACLKFLFVCFLFKPDIVHIHLSSYFSFYRKLALCITAKIFKKKLLIHLHGAEFKHFYNFNRINNFFIQKVFCGADGVIVLSERWKMWAVALMPAAKIFVLCNPVAVSSYENMAPWQQRGVVKKTLFMGIIGDRKGTYDIIKIIPDVVKVYSDARFIFAGNGEIEQAKALCKKIDVLDKVEFPGWVSGELEKKYWSEADIYMLPSYSENLPVSVLKAMAAGLPVITTRVGGIPDIVEDGVNGYLIEHGDIKALKEKLLLLLSSQETREKFGRSNKLKAKELFDVEIIVNQLCNIYGTIST